MPAGAGGIRAGRAFVEAYLDDSQVVRGIRRVQGRLRAFGSSVTRLGTVVGAMGVAIATPFIAAARQFATVGDTLNKMAARTGIAVESLSSLGFAAEQSGSSLEALERGLTGMSRFLLNAERGSAAAIETLNALGLTFEDLQGLSPEDQFKLLADRIAEIEDPTQRAALAMQAFGRSGQDLLPLLSQGAEGIAALQREAEELGIVMSEADAQAAADLTDALNRLWRVIEAGTLAIGAALAPQLTEMVTQLTNGALAVVSFIQQNEELVGVAFRLGAGMAAVGAAMVATGTAINIVAGGMGGIIRLFGLAASAATAFGVASSAAWAAATLGISLLVTGLIAIGAAFVGLQRKFGFFNPLIDAFRQAGQVLERQLQPAFARVAAAVSQLFDALQPLLPLLQVALVASVSALADILTTVLVPAIQFIAAEIERLVELLAAFLGLTDQLQALAAALGIAFGVMAGIEKPDDGGKDLDSLAEDKAEREEKSIDEALAGLDDADEPKNEKMKDLAKLADGDLDGQFDDLADRTGMNGQQEGTFSSMASRMFFSGPGGSNEEEQLKTLTKIEQHTKRIAQNEALVFQP